MVFFSTSGGPWVTQGLFENDSKLSLKFLLGQHCVAPGLAHLLACHPQWHQHVVEAAVDCIFRQSDATQKQCKLWGLREALRMLGQDDKQYGWMSSRVSLASGERPGRNAVRTFFKRVDEAGDTWYPGFFAGARGRKPALTPKKRVTTPRPASQLE